MTLGKGRFFEVPKQAKNQPLTVGTNSAEATVLELGTLALHIATEKSPFLSVPPCPW